MKKKTFVLLLIAAFSSVKNVNAQSIFQKWPELDTFHAVMSETFHPAEEGNLAPIKSRIAEMEQKASKLSKTTIPAEFDSPAIQKAVRKLSFDSRALGILIKNKETTDEQITQALSHLHDVFHEIVGLCREEKHESKEAAINPMTAS